VHPGFLFAARLYWMLREEVHDAQLLQGFRCSSDGVILWVAVETVRFEWASCFPEESGSLKK